MQFSIHSNIYTCFSPHNGTLKKAYSSFLKLHITNQRCILNKKLHSSNSNPGKFQEFNFGRSSDLLHFPNALPIPPKRNSGFEYCRKTFGGAYSSGSVQDLVNGFSRTHHHHPTGNHDTDVMPGTAHFHSLHQTFEPVASWRKLCTDNGNEYQTFTYTHLHLHRAADRNGDRILRPGRFYRAGSTARHTVAVQQRRPPDTCPRHYADGTYQHASLRHHRQEIPASGELYHRLARCSGHFMGNS